MKEYFKIVGLSLIPTLLVFIGKSDSFFDFLKLHKFIDANTNISTSQITCFSIGIFWAGLITPLQLAQTKKRLEQKEKGFTELLEFTKESYFKSLKENLKKHSITFKTRIFVPQRGIRALWKETFSKIRIFQLKDVKGISDKLQVKYLNFEVEPNCQGLVGKAYQAAAQNKQNETIFVDCDVNASNYNLNAYQTSKTADVKFCSTAPIYNKDSKVVAILAIDSSDKVNLNDIEIQTLKEQIIYYCAFVDKHTNLQL